MAKRLVQGNDAIALGAIKAGLGFFAGYPITPSSEIMHTIAGHAKNSLKFIQTEDELAAINMIIGSSMAGRKSFTSTSGPGFSLMQEGIGYAYMTKTPIVIANCQRVGPSTGMPTLPSQGDVLQSVYGRHGDQQTIVFYPNSVEECYKITIEAFNAAEESQSPVILLSDALLSHLYETVDLKKIKCRIVKRTTPSIGKHTRHFTGVLSKNNAPCTRDKEHYKRFLLKRKKEILKTADRYSFYEYIRNEKSDTLIIAYGITSRIISPLSKKFSIFRPIRLFPILGELKRAVRHYKKVIVIEMNDGQYKKEIEQATGKIIQGISMLGGDYSLNNIKHKL